MYDTNFFMLLCFFIWPILIAFNLGEANKYSRLRIIIVIIIMRHTLPFSSRFVSMTIVAVPCSQIIRQKSSTDPGTGPIII